MKYGFSQKLFGYFYHSSCMKQAKRQHLQIDSKTIKQEYRAILTRAKDIGKSRLMSSYCMGAYFIALNRNTTLSPEECYALYKDGLSANQLFHKVMGNADSYLDVKKLPARKKWSADSHKRKYENDWVVDILEGGANDDFELGYDYHTCGICSLCRDEGCFELAKYLCRMDYVLADMMHMRLVRTQTIAEGASSCDFRYSRMESASGKKSLQKSSRFITSRRFRSTSIHSSSVSGT